MDACGWFFSLLLLLEEDQFLLVRLHIKAHSYKPFHALAYPARMVASISFQSRPQARIAPLSMYMLREVCSDPSCGGEVVRHRWRIRPVK